MDEMSELTDYISGLEQKLPEYGIKNNVRRIKGDFGLVADSIVDLLDGYGDDENIVSQLIFGEPVHILEHKEGWLHVQGQDMYSGWVRDEFVEKIYPAKFRQWRSGDFFTVTVRKSYLYPSPDPASDSQRKIYHGTMLKAEEIEENFVRIYFPGKDSLWISRKDVKPHSFEASSIRENIIDTAEKYLGTPYLWGGTTIKGVDCSGFLQRVLSTNGIYYPRDSDQQYQFCEKIDFEELRMGDIIFFSTYKEGPSHMGFYMGDDLFIHASGREEEVFINSLDPASDKYNDNYESQYYGSAELKKNNEFLAPWMKPEYDDIYL